MKKICIVTTISGTLKSFVVDIANRLHDNCGYDVTLICSKDEAFAKSLPDGIRYIPVHMDRGISFSGLAAVMRFIKLFKEEKFDLVQYATPNAACYASIAAKIAKVPVRLYSQWGIRYVGFTGLKRKIFKGIEKLVCHLSTDIRTASHGNKLFSVREGLYRADKAAVIGEGGTIGVDMSVFDLAKKSAWNVEVRDYLDIEPDAFVFGFCGRVSTDKGCAELFKAFKEAAALANNAKLLIVGPLETDCGLDVQLQEWVKNSSDVIFTGRVPKEQVQKYYAAMDVLVHPTYREGFGMVIQEAGAMAVPVITTKIPGASEVMEDGISCRLVEVKNAVELSEAMLELASDPAECERLGMAAYERTKRFFERSVRLQLLQKDYEELLKDE